MRGRGLGARVPCLRRSGDLCLTSTGQIQPLEQRIRDVPTTTRLQFDQYYPSEDFAAG